MNCNKFAYYLIFSPIIIILVSLFMGFWYASLKDAIDEYKFYNSKGKLIAHIICTIFVLSVVSGFTILFLQTK